MAILRVKVKTAEGVLLHLIEVGSYVLRKFYLFGFSVVEEALRPHFLPILTKAPHPTKKTRKD